MKREIITINDAAHEFVMEIEHMSMRKVNMEKLKIFVSRQMMTT